MQIGCVFYDESIFVLCSDASKIVFACTTPFLADLGAVLIDCQRDTGHIHRLGSQLMGLAGFQTALKDLNARPLRWNIGCGVVAGNLP